VTDLAAGVLVMSCAAYPTPAPSLAEMTESSDQTKFTLLYRLNTMFAAEIFSVAEATAGAASEPCRHGV
jgi:hypothetical protein